MNRSRLLALSGMAALLWQACGPQSTAPQGPRWQTDPSFAGARQQFGAPNQNIVLNPRAFKVSETPSAGDVEQILPNQLVIGAQHATWLLARTPGDVLYCGVACGGRGFLRRIVDIQQDGDRIIVDTKPAGLTDIVVSGWIYGEFELPNPMTATSIPPGGLPSIPVTIPAAGPSGTPTQIEVPAPRTEKTDNDNEPWKGGGEIGPDVSMSGTVTFSDKIIFSMAVSEVPVTTIIPDPTCSVLSCPGSWIKVKAEQAALVALFPTLGGDAPELTQFTFEIEPEIEIEDELTIGVTAAATYSKELYKSPSITLAPLVIGPVEIMVDLSISVEATAALEGEISINGTVTNTYSASLGIEYTTAEGWQGIATGSRSHKASLNAKGEAGLNAGLEFEPQVADTIYGVVGPVFGLVGGVGAEVKVEVTKTLAGSGSGGCTEKELEVDAYVKYGVQGGAEVKLFPFYTIWDKVVTDTLWSNTIEWKIASLDLGEEDGGCEEGTSSGTSSSGTSSSSGGSTGTSSSGSSGGGTSGGGTGGAGTTGGTTGNACSSSSDCQSCEVCEIPANFCSGPLTGPSQCTTDADDMVGMTCSSTSDCDPCGTYGLTCANCSALGVGCSGNCCQYSN